MKISLVAFCMCCFLSSVSYATADFVYRRPVEFLPSVKRPSSGFDIFDFALAAQVHASLFVIDEHGVPVNYLVDTFEVSKDRRVYSFRLKSRTFHNGVLITNRHVKDSLQTSLRDRSKEAFVLSNVLGVRRFLAGKSAEIEGIVVDNEDDLLFEIVLKKPDPQTVFKLADFRLSILFDAEKPDIGAGPYKVLKRSKTEISLSSFDAWQLTDSKDFPRSVVLKKTGKKSAIDGFREGYYHDLFYYSLDPKDLKPLKGLYKTVQVSLPRTYVIAVNSFRIPDKKVREMILSSFDWPEITKSCYEESVASGFFPPGRIWHRSGQVPWFSTTEQTGAKVGPFRIAIGRGLGGEECLKAEMKAETRERGHSFDISIEGFPKVVEGWDSKQLDAAVFWLEADPTNSTFIWSLQKRKSMYIADPGDRHMEELIAKLAETVNIKHSIGIASQIEDRLRQQATVMPFLQPKVSFTLWKGGKVRFGTRSPSTLPITEIQLLEDDGKR